MRKINLFYLIDGGHNWGGAESNLLSVAKRINRERYNVEIGCLTGGRVAEIFRGGGLTVTVINMKNKWDVVAVIRLVQLLKEEKIDILHTCLYPSNTFGRIAAILARTPVSLAWEQGMPSYFKTPRHVQVDRVLNKFTDAIVAASSAVKHSIVEVEGIGESKIQVVHNCVEPPAFDPSSDAIATASVGASASADNVHLQSDLKLELGLRPEDRVLPYVASLGPPKGHGGFLPAIREVVKIFPDVKFLFVGEGPLRQEIEKDVERLGIKENVLMCGFRRDVAEILSIAEFYVHPTITEALGIAILEAMVMGKAVVASRVDGIPEVVVEGETGLLFPPQDTEATSRAIIELLQSPSRAREMGKKGRPRALNYFSAERSARELEKIYEQFIVAKILPREGHQDEESQKLLSHGIKELFNCSAKGRDSTLASNPFWAYEDKVRQRAVFELLRPAPGERILEVGCGSGRDMILFSSKGARYVGLDYGYGIVGIAKERLVKEKGMGTLTVADATKLPFKNCSFDKVSCSEVLEHIPEYTKALKEINRVLKPGGKATFTVPNRHSFKGLARWYRSLIYRVFNRCDLHPYDEWKTRRELEVALKESGLEVQEEIGANFTPEFFSSPSLCQRLTGVVGFVEERIRWRLPGWGNTLAMMAVKGPLGKTNKGTGEKDA
ncbi:MAG: glycosyltransferase [Candidatus Brocadiaceae bacterium]|nr:glycosyltransferase [Candidatus Brocadiaceae bacterium]